jgi:D-alanyl-D-alanine carboxypeptidase
MPSRTLMTSSTTMMGYSTSKTVTAVAVLRLVQEQKVRLDESVEHYVGTTPYGPKVTVRQLLSHTSGIPNPMPLQWVHLATQHQNVDQRAA